MRRSSAQSPPEDFRSMGLAFAQCPVYSFCIHPLAECNGTVREVELAATERVKQLHAFQAFFTKLRQVDFKRQVGNCCSQSTQRAQFMPFHVDFHEEWLPVLGH